MKHYLVQYDYTQDRDGRMAIVEEHRSYQRALAESGNNVVSGARGPEEAPGAVFLFRADGREHAQRLIDGDPFVEQGFVAQTSTVEYVPMSGELVQVIRGDD